MTASDRLAETGCVLDMFVLRDGLILRSEVWNDSAEILLDRAGLAEASIDAMRLKPAAPVVGNRR